MMPSDAQTGTKLRVLVVEDEALIAEEIQDRLARLGFCVIAVSDTAERAIRIAEGERPELVLMDIRLKGKMDGIEAAKHIYQQLQVPVVYLTAHSDQATLQRAKATAPFGYVLKPFQEKDLLIAIEMANHRHGLEQRLKASELKYAATLASIADGVIATDIEGRVTFMNPVAEALTAWLGSEALGLPIEQVFPVVHEASRTALESLVQKALAQQSVVTSTDPVLLFDRSGSAIPIEHSAALILDPRGGKLGVVLAFRDIRQRRLAEAALHNAEQQLRQAQKMEAVGRLAGGVAHDFNNLLTVINGFSEILLSGSRLDEASRSIIREISKAGERAAALTRQLLTFSRKQVLQSVLLDLNALITNLGKMLGSLIGKDIHLITAFSPASAMVIADPSQIEQIILNLAVNARDAMPRGGELRIETSIVTPDRTITETCPEVRPGRYVLLAVSDTGTGMNKDTMSHLFEPFFTTKGVGKGTGLGLATVFGIVKQSGGHIFVSSEVGRGSTFKVYLPFVGDRAASPHDAPGSQGGFSGVETILLVEDDPAVRSVSSFALRTQGYTVLVASGGEEALRLCAEHPETIHLLVTDVVMPSMSGRHLAERLAALKPNIRVLYVSGHTDDSTLRHGVLEGEVAFLQKPFTPTNLARKVREVLNQPG